MGQHLDLTLDPHFFDVKLVRVWFGMLLDPNSEPTDEIGGKNRPGFLDVNGRFGAHLQTIEVEDLFGFLDPGFDGLAAIVSAKPGRQIFGYWGIPKVGQSAVLELFVAGVKAFQPHGERIGTMFQLEGRPGDHLRILAHPGPDGFGLNALLQSLNDFVAMQFGVQFVTHFDQQGDVIILTKARINPKPDFVGGEIVCVLLRKALQAVLQDFFLLRMGLEQPLCLFEAFLGGFDRLFSAKTATCEALDAFRFRFRSAPGLLKLGSDSCWAGSAFSRAAF